MQFPEGASGGLPARRGRCRHLGIGRHRVGSLRSRSQRRGRSRSTAARTAPPQLVVASPSTASAAGTVVCSASDHGSAARDVPQAGGRSPGVRRPVPRRARISGDDHCVGRCGQGGGNRPSASVVAERVAREPLEGYALSRYMRSTGRIRAPATGCRDQPACDLARACRDLETGAGPFVPEDQVRERAPRFRQDAVGLVGPRLEHRVLGTAALGLVQLEPSLRSSQPILIADVLAVAVVDHAERDTRERANTSSSRTAAAIGATCTRGPSAEREALTRRPDTRRSIPCTARSVLRS